MPAPTKLTPETQAAIVQAVAAGATYRAAAEAAGIAYNTFNDWMKAGEAAHTGAKRALYDAVQKANASARLILLLRVQEAGKPHEVMTTRTITNADGSTRTETTTTVEFDWRAAAWILERRFADEYAQHVKNQLSGDASAPLTIGIRAVDYRAGLEALAPETPPPEGPAAGGE